MIAQRAIRTDSYFGFYNKNLLPQDQRFSGFNNGRWITPRESAFIEVQRKRWHGDSIRPTKLYSNEADISLAARSFHGIVLTRDRKPGPLTDALAQGGSVLFLDELDASGLSLADFTRGRHVTPPAQRGS
jgi:hypothetical protein